MRDDIRRKTIIYQNKARGVFVYEGELLTMHLPVAIKDQHFSSLDDANTALEEAIIHTRLIHPNIARIYSTGMSQQEDEYVISLALELLKHDLQREIETRHDKQNYWSENELWAHFICLVDALAFAQRASVCHRDVKPQNIFVESSGTLKIGDFGSSKLCFNKATIASTLQGSPYYLSPVLKRKFMDAYSDSSTQESQQLVEHNVYKSDVYSLGLTFLHMAKLEPSKKMATFCGLRQIVANETASLNYTSRVKVLLQLMLEEEESKRMDFLVLQQHIHTQSSEEHSSLMDTATSTAEIGSETLLALFNASANSEYLQRLFNFSARLQAEVTIKLECHVCGSVFCIDVTAGCASAENLFFCSQECYVLFTSEAVAKSASSSFDQSIQQGSLNYKNICELCHKRSADIRELTVCSKCEAKQKRAMVKMKSEECALCGKRWPKHSDFVNLFRKHISGIQLPTCKHKLCSQGCLKQTAKTGMKCPKCNAELSSQFLKFMNVV